MKKIALLVVSILLSWSISGCVPLAFVAGSSAGGAIVSDKRSMKTMIQDRDMVNEALKKISANPELRQETHIVIAGFNHVMLMVGQAPTEELRAKAHHVANTVSNVKRIYNQVTIQSPISTSAQAEDSWITTKVKSAMLVEKGLHSGQIKVVTEDGVVYLMGIVTPKQADLAANAASRVSGVVKVVKLFEYEQ